MTKTLSHNPSISLSSSSTVSFDANNICSSKSATAAGCLAGIWRRILCSRSLPTHPSDHINDQATSIPRESECKEKNMEEKVMPRIVARLMGLESMPNGIISGNHDSITTMRCRSMNSMDCKGSNDRHRMQGEHRSVKSTLSFREMPTFLEFENEEFFVLSFENGSETKTKRVRGRKYETGNGELKLRNREKSKSNEGRPMVTEKSNKGDQKTSKEKNLSPRISNKPALEVDISTKTCKEQCGSDGGKLTRKKKKVKSVEHGSCSSEESSPVQVLDFDQFLVDRDCPTSDSLESNSRRKLSPEPEECQSPRQRNDNNLIFPDDRKTKKTDCKCFGPRNRDCNHQNYLDICKQICNMTEAEITEESLWMYRRNILKDEDFEDICADFESQILDQSLGELVHLLTDLHFL